MPTEELLRGIRDGSREAEQPLHTPDPLNEVRVELRKHRRYGGKVDIDDVPLADDGDSVVESLFGHERLLAYENALGAGLESSSSLLRSACTRKCRSEANAMDVRLKSFEAGAGPDQPRITRSGRTVMQRTVAPIVGLWQSLTARLDGAGETLPPLVLRLIMGWEFWESGLEKLHGENWFADIQSRFPFPFDVIPAGISWGLSTWFEVIGAVMLWLGLGTRVFAFILLFLTFVATAAVHWPSMLTMWSDLAKGYAITDMGHGNFKLPLLFAVMLLPLIFGGGGRLSLDHLVSRLANVATPEPVHGPQSGALAALVLAIPFLMLIPVLGAALLIAALGFAIAGRHAGDRLRRGIRD